MSALVASAALGLWACVAAAGEPSAEAVLDVLGDGRGLVVHVGATDGSLAEALVRAQPVLVYAVAREAAAEAQLRKRFAEAGVHGQATGGRLGSDGAIPVADEEAACVIADLDGMKELRRAELLRVLRPLGKLYVRENAQWRVVVKPRPPDVDDWPQYFHDAAMSDLSADRRAGPARGLQWETGPQAKHSNGVRVIDDLVVGHDEQGLWARDAYSGLPVWRRPDLQPATRFGLLVDHTRVYIYPAGKRGYLRRPCPHQLALDLRTGETVLEYTNGLSFLPPPEVPKSKEKEIFAALYARSKDFQARLADGKLVQVSGPGLAVLEAKTGKRLWGAEAPEGLVWAHPLVADGVLYLVQGPPVRSFAYTHWPMSLVERVLAFDLPTGRQLWAWKWNREMPGYFERHGVSVPGLPKSLKLAPPDKRAAAAYNMAFDRGRLVLALRAELDSTPIGRGLIRQLVLDARSGRLVAYGRTPAKERKGIGGGHSHLRVLPAGGRWWFVHATGIYGSADPSEPTNPEKFDLTYAKLPRPVGCTVYRASPNYLFGSLTTYALDGPGVHHTNVTRTACDVGAFPANGLTYITPNHCFCQPYLPGHNAFHPRRPRPPDDAGRLERGAAAPAPAAPSDDAWPMYLGDNLRSSWLDAPLPTTLAQAWAFRLAEPLSGLIGQEWANQWYGHGPITGLSVAEGVGVLALRDRQVIVAIHPATGKELWRVAVDGRVDSQPTIYRGAVYAGTRAGWLYALNRDTGELIWRFRAAPRRERIVVDGQLESPWPLFGTVTVDGEGVWAVAGRHNDCDGGLWWWRLDPATGAVRASGRLGRDKLRSTTAGAGATLIATDWPSGANCPPVTDGRLFLMARVHCRRDGGKLVPWNFWSSKQSHRERAFWESAYNTGILVPGNQGLLNRLSFLGGYKMSSYGFVQARLFAYRGGRFVTVGGTGGFFEHRGGHGGSCVRAFRRRPALAQVAAPDPKSPGKPRMRLSGSELLWENPMPLARRGDGVQAMAVAGERVLVALSVTDRDRWRERQKMPHRLLVLGLDDGKLRQELPLPAAPIPGGLSVARGRVFVATDDGTLTCFAGVPEPEREAAKGVGNQ